MATEYRSPGVYVEEVDRGIKPIQGVGTAIAAFVGFTERAGPENIPEQLLGRAVLVTNWTQYTQTFGGFVSGANLPYAVYGYFQNGGGQCYVISVAYQDRTQARPAQITVPGTAEAESGVLLIKARQGGPSGNKLEVVIEPHQAENTPAAEPSSPPEESASEKAAPKEAGETFTLVVKSNGKRVERFEGLSMANTKNNVKTMLAQSTLIEVEMIGKGGSLAERRPRLGSYVLSGGGFPLTPVTPPQFIGDVAKREGLGALEALDNVTIVACPDLMSGYEANKPETMIGIKNVQQAMLVHCQRMRYRFAILDAPPNLNAQDIRQWRNYDANYDSKYGALYYPWIKIANPLPENGPTLTIPPCGHIAGIYARSDGERGVHKAPANEVVLGALGLENNVTMAEQGDLNPDGINCIRAFPGRGIRVWGARTLSQTDSSWNYVNVRRLFNYIEASIEAGTQWVVFEPNDQNLWAKVRRDVSAFLRLVWRSGALFGATPEEAFYVKCDAELNTLDERNAGRLIIEIGLAPVKPAEFVIFRISQWAGPNAEAG